MNIFSSQDLASTVWAFVTVGHASPWLFDAMAEVANRSGGLLISRPCDTVWAFAMVGHASSALFGSIARVAASRLKDFNSQGLANTV